MSLIFSATRRTFLLTSAAAASLPARVGAFVPRALGLRLGQR